MMFVGGFSFNLWDERWGYGGIGKGGEGEGKFYTRSCNIVFGFVCLCSGQCNVMYLELPHTQVCMYFARILTYNPVLQVYE